MKFLFHNDTAFNKIKKYVSDTWTCLERGEGEEEIANHGWSRVQSFSQETGAIGQQGHGVTKLSRSYTLKSQVQDAHDSPTQLPFFSSSLIATTAFEELACRVSSALRTVLALFFSLFITTFFGSSRAFISKLRQQLRNSIRANSASQFFESSLRGGRYLLPFVLKRYLVLFGFIFSMRAHAEMMNMNEKAQGGAMPLEKSQMQAVDSSQKNNLSAGDAASPGKMIAMPSRFMKMRPEQKSPEKKLRDVSEM